MGFLKNILDGKKKEPISLIEFVKVLASWAADLNSIRENVELTTFPENVGSTGTGVTPNPVNRNQCGQ